MSMVDLKAEYDSLKALRDTEKANVDSLKTLKSDIVKIFKFLKDGITDPTPQYEDVEGVPTVTNQADIDLMAVRGQKLNSFFTVLEKTNLEVFETLLYVIGVGSSDPFRELVQEYDAKIKTAIDSYTLAQQNVDIKREEIKEFLFTQEGITE